MKIVWTSNAELSFAKELEFINKKWSATEVLKFIDLVDDYIYQLESGVIEGKISLSTNIYSFVISRQTTLYFEVDKSSKTIYLLLFWNNKQNPTKLKDYIKNNQ